MTNEHPTEEPAPGIVERARLAAQKALMAHTCIYQVDADGDNLLLVDALSRGDTIADGRREIEYLAEDIAGAVAEAFAGGALLDLNTGHWWGVRAAETTDLTAAHRRLWNALDRIASLNRTELPDHIDPFTMCVCMAQDVMYRDFKHRQRDQIGPQDDVGPLLGSYWKKRVKEADDASE